MRSRLTAITMSFVLILSIAGCAKQVPEFQAKYYPECYDPIEKLCKEQSNAQETKGAIAGGLLGALGGAIIGGLTTGKVEGALVGAGVGAAAGAMTGFFAARLNKIKDQNQRLAAYQEMLGEESHGWDIQRASVERAYKCYGEQIKILQMGIRKKQITREEFIARMNEISDGIQYINNYWADAQTRMDEHLADADSWLKNEDAIAEKNRQQQAQREVKRKKDRTNTLRETTKKENERINAMKESLQAQKENLMKEALEEGGNWASLDTLLAMS